MKKMIFGVIFNLLLIFPMAVSAESNLIIDCDDNNVAGQTFECILKSDMDDSVYYDKIEGRIDLVDADIAFEWESGFSGKLENNFLTINSNNLIDNSIIGKMKIKFPVETTGNKEIGFNDVKFYNNTNEVGSCNKISDNINVKSDIKTLESLTLSDCDGCNLSPKFSSNLTIYIVKTNTDSINISAIPSGNATVSGDGEKKLTKSKETFELVVTSEAGNTKKYKITVHKEKSGSSDNTLKSLTLNNGELELDFSSDITNYNVTFDKEEITINALANDLKATITGIGKKILKYGENEFTVAVMSENGHTKNYLINVNRPDTRNSNSYLKEIIINGEPLNFEKDILEYHYKVGNSITSLDIEAVAELESSKITITGGDNLVVGENEIIIEVLAEDETLKEYKVIVTRDEIDRADLYLESLEIEGYNINFSKDDFDYELTINGEKELIIDAIAENGTHNVEILGNSDLKNGSIIKIIITDEFDNSNIYKIKINLENEEEIVNDNNNITKDINYIPIIMTSLLVILLILNIIEITKKIKYLKH